MEQQKRAGEALAISEAAALVLKRPGSQQQEGLSWEPGRRWEWESRRAPFTSPEALWMLPARLRRQEPGWAAPGARAGRLGPASGTGRACVETGEQLFLPRDLLGLDI